MTEENKSGEKQVAHEDNSNNPAEALNYCEDTLLQCFKRQAAIVQQAVDDFKTVPSTVEELSYAYEKQLFAPKRVPKKQDNGIIEANPRLNFYPTFIVPETLASYHVFFCNSKIPFSCKANRSKANEQMRLKHNSALPGICSLTEVSKIYEGLGNEPVADNAVKQENSHLVELKHDNPRLAVVKRNLSVTHFAYPAVNLPPKIMDCVMQTLIMKKHETDNPTDNEDMQVVTDNELAKWLNINKDDAETIEQKRKTMLSVVLVTVLLKSLQSFFACSSVVKKIGENLHYLFHKGYVKQACSTSGVDITNVVSYMGILHENRVGQTTLHNLLKGEARLDYVRDTIFLYLIYTWQTAMGVWMQCLETSNLKELKKILTAQKKKLWTGFNEATIANDLSEILLPKPLLFTLQSGLPDIVNQSMMHIFRSFVLERSGILPSMVNALPSDFVPIEYKECPPTLWAYTYLLKLANYFMYHCDLDIDSSGEGLLECYCRCNLCCPHRCIATNPDLLMETQCIGTFELQGPDGASSLKLTPALWTSAFLRKFEEKDYYFDKIFFYEDRQKHSKVPPTACVINQSNILGQLNLIKKAREEFLLKKGHGIYLDPITGEELNGAEPSVLHNEQKASTKNCKNRCCCGAEGGGRGRGCKCKRGRDRRPGGHNSAASGAAEGRKAEQKKEA